MWGGDASGQIISKQSQDSVWDVAQSSQTLWTVWWLIPPTQLSALDSFPRKEKPIHSLFPPTHFKRTDIQSMKQSWQSNEVLATEQRSVALGPKPLQMAQLPKSNPNSDYWSNIFSRQARIYPPSSNTVNTHCGKKQQEQNSHCEAKAMETRLLISILHASCMTIFPLTLLLGWNRWLHLTSDAVTKTQRLYLPRNQIWIQ